MPVEVQRKTCPVCKEEFPYIDVREVPKTCSKRMCQINYKAHLGRMTPDGQSPSLERLGVWNPSSSTLSKE